MISVDIEHRGTEESGATFSPCGEYRYALWRIWGRGRMVTFVGLNPSTADETEDDPTIRRCIGFAKSWGCGGIYMVNIFGYRSTDPKKLKRVDDPVGPENDAQILLHAILADKTVASWGTHGALNNRGRDVRDLIKQHSNLHCLGTTKDGHPRHPLYLRSDTELIDL